MISRSQFDNEVQAWAEKIGVKPKEIHLRSMKRKWASCSTKGRLSFNTDIFKQSPQKRSEIIVHELLHLRYPKHNKMFNAMLKFHLK